MPEKTQAEIPYAVLEYTAIFEKPLFEAFGTTSIIIAAVLNALEPWGFNIDGVEMKPRTEKLSENAIVFRRTNPTSPGLSLTVGFSKIVVTAENPDWTEAERLIAGIGAGLNAVIQAGPAKIQSQQLSLGMHVQVKTKAIKDVTAPLLSPEAFKLLDGEVKFPGIILIREKSSMLIDGSVAYANGLFVRISREHPAEATLQQLAKVLRKDEEQLFDVLGLEGIL